MMTAEQKSLMRRMQEVSFALDDTALFLNTHPTNQDAIKYYQRYQKLNQQLRDEYTSKYGPLSTDDPLNANEWTWATSPWPWETEA